MEERSFRVVENSTLEHSYNQKQKSDNAATLNDCDDKKREKSSDRETRHTGSAAATGAATTDDVSATPHSKTYRERTQKPCPNLCYGQQSDISHKAREHADFNRH